MLRNELATLRSRMTSLRHSGASETAPSRTTDPVILEKLNLAYEDLTAIYDLRSIIQA